MCGFLNAVFIALKEVKPTVIIPISFVKSGLDFAQSNFHVKQIRLSVAAFNIRAIGIYEKIGFKLSSSVTYSKTQNIFQVMEYM